MSIFNQSQKAYLLLADGTVFEGCSFGAEGTVIGEVVFTTSLTGYQETLTDPSYYGQIVTQTFPLIGNYGVNDGDYESARSYVSGYIVREWCNTPSNFRCQGNIDTFLKEQNIIGIHSIDTRCLTRIIREAGVMNGVITTENVYEKKDELLKQALNESEMVLADGMPIIWISKLFKTPLPEKISGSDFVAIGQIFQMNFPAFSPFQNVLLCNKQRANGRR